MVVAEILLFMAELSLPMEAQIFPPVLVVDSMEVPVRFQLTVMQ